MRLLVLSSWCPVPAVNGSKQRAFALLRELARHHEIDLLTFAEAGEETHLHALAGLVRHCEWVRGNPHKPLGRLRARDYLGAMPRSYARSWSPAMARLAAGHAAHADAVVAMQIGTAVYADAFRSRPSIFEEAEVDAIRGAISRAATPWSRAARRLAWGKYRRYVCRATRRFTATTVVSEAERALLVAGGADSSRVHIVPNGVDLDAPERADPFAAPGGRGAAFAPSRVPDRLVFAGAPSFAPNREAVDWFVEHAWPGLRARRPSARFHVTGETAGCDLSAWTAAGIDVEGFVDDVRAMVASAAVAVVPIWSGGGTRLKILEAMALGTPVVTTSKGAEGIDVEHGTHLLVADTPQSMVDAIVRLLDDAPLARRLASAARARVAERYTWAEAGRRLDAILRAAVASSRGTRRTG